jgi:hypothetical protein
MRSFAAETWTLIEKDKQTINAFDMRCLRCLLGVSLLDHIRNDDIRKRLGIKKTIINIIKAKRLKWFGHVTRSNTAGYVYAAYRDDFKRKRLPGRPRKRWKDQIKDDLGLPLATAERVAKDRENWRNLTGMTGARILRGLCRN